MDDFGGTTLCGKLHMGRWIFHDDMLDVSGHRMGGGWSWSKNTSTWALRIVRKKHRVIASPRFVAYHIDKWPTYVFLWWIPYMNPWYILSEMAIFQCFKHLDFILWEPRTLVSSTPEISCGTLCAARSDWFSWRSPVTDSDQLVQWMVSRLASGHLLHFAIWTRICTSTWIMNMV